MNDEQIVALYFERDELALNETMKSHGALCRSIANNILGSSEDAEECVSDALMKAWNAIPPERPANLGAYLARVTRNLAFDRFRWLRAQKRGGGECAVILDELAECIPDRRDDEREASSELREAVGRFVRELPERRRSIFIRRYFFSEEISAIASRYGMTDGSVTTALCRMRKKLRVFLEREGFSI